MEWIDRMNNAIGYVELHLCDEVDPGEISRIMACPYPVFLRSFVQITDIPLSEYIRRRKLTCAAYEIQNTKAKIIDIALKYGYESSDAFCVAFKRLHGITPMKARKSAVRLKFYSQLHFTLTIKGVSEMDYRLMEKEAFKVIGRRRTTPRGGGTWEIVKSDGSAEAMKKLSGHMCDLGLCFGFDEEGNNDYMCGIEYDKEELPEFESYTFPNSTWLVFEASGSISEGVLGDTWKRIYNEFLPQSEYKQIDLPTVEKYIQWDNDTDVCKVEIWIPVKK